MAGRRSNAQKKADALLGRFPVTDLAEAVSLNGSRRENFLVGFVKGIPKGSFAPLRQVTSRIYGVQPPLLELPLEDWPAIERSLRVLAYPEVLERNIQVGRDLFKHAREENYLATSVPPQVFRYGRGTASIGLDFYLTQGNRLFFQFPHFRSKALADQQAITLCSIISHAYAFGDFSSAEVEIVQFSKTKRNKYPHIISPATSSLMGRDELSAEIDDVYRVLRDIAEGLL